ncbi:predicted protein [Sclerotinia sclerotiorum 1980 UF-70]|uniref:Uncharacterized protein n=1 Tax=Sclerotinia sclerotiorum (strain ATCC 18683 / 1980 / Ss-1) TaxID=665079 RepID=A7EKT2_SCLS1|nr:predicted protein [Sclerotinia sclerotiorum 1980 UF-70]EDO03448.1 predicted protein [Sclerotinia sclerotiorum 1980 UF-70]
MTEIEILQKRADSPKLKTWEVKAQKNVRSKKQPALWNFNHPPR